MATYMDFRDVVHATQSLKCWSNLDEAAHEKRTKDTDNFLVTK
jgi:hypothetical protein